MNLSFTTEELAQELERALGFRIRSIQPLKSGHTFNFKAVRDSDGMAFAVKCSPPERRDDFVRLVRHIDEVKGTKACQRIFRAECPEKIRDMDVVCTTWSDGKKTYPDKLTERQLEEFVGEFKRFADAMCNASMVKPSFPVAELREDARKNCRGIGGWLIRRIIDKELPETAIDYADAEVGVSHSDMHLGNLLFVDGHIDCFLDFEDFRVGHPSEDIVYYFVCAAEHLRWYAQHRKRAILSRFAQAVRLLPYSQAAWTASINRVLLYKIYKKMCKNARIKRRRGGVLQAFNLMFCARFYREMKRIVKVNS